jgi:hypothetical protein
MEKRVTADPNKELESLGVGLVFAAICTSLPLEQALRRFNGECPTGISSQWVFTGKDTDKEPCPDDPKKTHYRLHC